MTGILAEFEYVDRTSNLRCGGEGPLVTRFDTTGELYRFCLKEYGRCVGACYQERPDGKTQKIGWVFQKRVKYTDVNEYYLQETWVSIHTAMPERHTVYHYAELED